MIKKAINNSKNSRILEVLLIGNEVIYYAKNAFEDGHHIGILLCETEKLAYEDYISFVKENNMIEI